MTQPRGRTPQDAPVRHGHVKVSRKAFHPEHGDELWLEQRRFSRWEAWLDLIQMARYRARTVTWRTHSVVVPRGHVLASVRTLADRWQWSTGAVQRFAAWCFRDGRMETAAETPIGTLYRLVNYEVYNAERDTERDGERDSNRDSDGTATETRKKKEKQVKQGEVQDPSAAAAPAAAARGHATWATPYCDAWREAFDAELPVPKNAKALRALIAKHGDPETLRRWRIYLHAPTTQAQYASAHQFAQSWGQWATPALSAVRSPAAGRRSAMEQQLEAGRVALGLDDPDEIHPPAVPAKESA